MSSDEPVDPPAAEPAERAQPTEPTPGPDLVRASLDAARAEARKRGLRTGRPGVVERRGGARRRGGFSGAGPDERDPQPLGAALRGLVEAKDWTATVADASVMGRWDEIVGADLAAHCRPESLRDGELSLVAESTAWATQVRALSGTLLKRLRDELGPGVVTKIRVHGPTAPSWQRGPRRIAGRGPRDTYG